MTERRCGNLIRISAFLISVLPLLPSAFLVSTFSFLLSAFSFPLSAFHHACRRVHLPRPASRRNDLDRPSVTLRAHYDGERIQLDEPFDLPLGVPLLLTVLRPEGDQDREAWNTAAREALARAFGDNEPEYTFSAF